MNEKILFPRIAIVGGPCSGKTKLLKKSQKHLKRKASLYYPLVAPEIATIHLEAGITFVHLGDTKFQNIILSSSIHMEAQHCATAEYMLEHGHKPVLLCDRGIFDGAAYIGDGNFDAVLANHGIIWEQELLSRYSMVVQLEIAPEEHFSSKSNKLRYEKKYSTAQRIQEVIRGRYETHPNFHWIENPKEGGFTAKLHRGEEPIMAHINNFFHIVNQ